MLLRAAVLLSLLGALAAAPAAGVAPTGAVRFAGAVPPAGGVPPAGAPAAARDPVPPPAAARDPVPPPAAAAPAVAAPPPASSWPAARLPTWVWPLPGRQQVSRPFALGVTVYAAGHRGADLPGTAGLIVRAAGSGRVTYAGLLAGRGVLVVGHGALRTTYEPVRATVRVGALVTAGQPVGTLDTGHAGCSVPACLHWGLRRGEDYLDPVRLLRPGPVRLLPRQAGS